MLEIHKAQGGLWTMFCTSSHQNNLSHSSSQSRYLAFNMSMNQPAQDVPAGGAGGPPLPPTSIFGTVPELTQEQAELIRLRQEVSTLRAQLVVVRNQNRPQDLQRRAIARTRAFNVNNRVGIRKCNWCHTRRETGPYAAYDAPQGSMNCGCSVEEAKFEESLASNGVGALEPDRRDSSVVRLSKLLRGPLLELLRRRYGYVDGDFDFDVGSGGWKEGKDADWWENEATDRENRFP